MSHKHKKTNFNNINHQNFKNKNNSLTNYNNHIKREVISIHQLSKIAMVFWIGGSCMVGVVIFPLLFKMVDQVTASQLVGEVLNILAYIGLVCLIVALIEVIINHKLALFKTKRFWYILIMDFLLIVNYFAVIPTIYKIRQAVAKVAHEIISVQSNVFDFWHSLSSIIFFSICVVGILYLIEM